MAFKFSGFGKAVSTAVAAAAKAATAAKARRPVSSSSGRAVAKPAAKPVAKKVVKKGPTARQKAAAGIAKKEADFRAQQAKESKQLETEFTQFRTGLEPLDELRQRLSEELDIPGLQSQLDPLVARAKSLGVTLNRLPEIAAEITKGQGLARQKLLTATRGEDLSRQLADVALAQGEFAGQLTSARGELTERLGVTQAQRQFDLSAFGQQADLLNTRLAREITGYTSQLQREFESIIGDIERAEDLKDQDTQRAFELAKLEKEANLEAQNIRLRSGLSQGQTAAKEAETKKTLQQISKLLSGGAQSQGKAGLVAMTKKALTQFPEFQKEIVDLANSFSTGLK